MERGTKQKNIMNNKPINIHVEQEKILSHKITALEYVWNLYTDKRNNLRDKIEGMGYKFTMYSGYMSLPGYIQMPRMKDFIIVDEHNKIIVNQVIAIENTLKKLSESIDRKYTQRIRIRKYIETGESYYLLDNFSIYNEPMPMP